MPELPEVETVRRSLLPVVLNKPIITVQVNYERILQHISSADFKSALIGNEFSQIKRSGKYLIFSLKDNRELVIHLRMTGRLIYYSDQSIPLAKHTSVIFGFETGDELRFEDVRKFATIDLVSKGNYEQVKGLFNLGIEPLSKEFSPEVLSDFVHKRSTKIKSVLLNQSLIAGLGNIYVDESLFMSGIHPERPANSLKKAEITRLHGAIQTVLKDAIDNQGTTLRDYRTGYGQEGSFQNRLQIYGRKGEKCPTCGTNIEHKKVAGRTSHFCPICQKE
ncbi:MAG: DNA-formamidopyrimidine glycosylase [Bacillota bacterium]|nr:DNA-formamidopyrimidine glycosylase [Bacillota bacterium]